MNTNNQLTQAVILAGGLGSRLRPITDKIPKPMVEIVGKPFIYYLIKLLKKRNIQDVLILGGYKYMQIQNYLKDGKHFGLNIEYSIAPEETETGERIKLAYDKLNTVFLLMYSDNYWPLPIDQMWISYLNSRKEAQITAYLNSDNITHNNVKIHDGIVQCYDSSRSKEDLNAVDIGFMILNRNVVSLITGKNPNFQRTVLPKLIKLNQLAYFGTHHRYYSISSHDRIPRTEKFLRKEKTILLDRDGVLNKKMGKAEYVTKWQDFNWLPGSLDALKLLKENGYRVLIITNQPGVARGLMSEQDLIHIHQRMKNEAEQYGGRIDQIYTCSCNWDADCFCRKPNPGLIFDAQRDFDVDLSETYFIGDDQRDIQAGISAGCKTLLKKDHDLLDNLIKTLIKEC